MNKKQKEERMETSMPSDNNNQNGGLEQRVKLLTIAVGVLFAWSAFLTYKSFSGARSIDYNTARLEAKTTTPDATTGNVANNPTSTQQSIKPPQPMIPEVDPATATSIAFEEAVFDYGKINEGEKVQHVYKFKNTGTKPLIISDAKGSCGCTVPQWSKEPLAPGQEGEIKVEFDSKGKVGKQSKTVTITANTIPAQTMLTIQGEVIKLEGK